MPHSQDPSTPRLKQEAAYHNITKSPKMAQNAVVPAHKVDVSDISFSKDVKTLESGFKMVYGKYKGGSPIVLQLPTMKAPFGVSGWTNDKGVIEKYSLDLSFNGMDSSEKLSSTYELFKGIDDLVVTTALENSTEWFKKRYTSKEVMEALYTPIVKVPKDDKYAPTIKLPLKEVPGGGGFTCAAFDTNRNKLDLKSANCKGSDVTAIVNLSHIWIAGGKFGVSWKVSQLRVQLKPSLDEYAFVDDDEVPVPVAAAGHFDGDSDDLDV